MIFSRVRSGTRRGQPADAAPPPAHGIPRALAGLRVAGCRIRPAALLFLGLAIASCGRSQEPQTSLPDAPRIVSRPASQPALSGATNAAEAGSPGSGLVDAANSEASILDQYRGRLVRRIGFEGVAAARLDPLPGRLAQAEGAPLKPEELKQSLRQLYATGLFETIEVEATPLDDGLALIFRGEPRSFVGTVSVEGAKGAAVNTQLARASQLDPGARFSSSRLDQAVNEMRSTLALNGFHEPQITHVLTPRPENQLVDVAFHVISGPQARIGTVQVSGESGMNVDEFRRYAHLRNGAHVDRDTANRALAGVLHHYRKEDRLEAEIKIEAEHYDAITKHTNFSFTANRGPKVRLQVTGVKINQERLHHLIPIYEEGSVDEDLLNEGNRRLRDFYQRLGYFDVKVGHQRQSSGVAASATQVEIFYNVDLGPRRHVERVSVEGNHYFGSSTLEDLLSVHAANTLDRHGNYSAALVSADISAIEGVYKNNGFAKVKVHPETSTPETGLTDTAASTTRAAAISEDRTAPLAVVYHIDEGDQQRVGSVKIEGATQADTAKLAALLNTAPGQLLSPQNLAGDRDALVTDYLSRGFEHPAVDVAQQADPENPANVNVTFRITEGNQVFVRNVLLTGLHYTRPQTVAHAITIHAGDPLDQTALTDTQRNLYEFALFNEVDTAVQNPNGGDTRKTVLIQAAEARRWALTYGFGFEAQTGQPQYNCGGIIASGATCNPEGKTGVSPRFIFDVTRNNLFGREQSASLQGTYGLLEQKLNLLYQVPHFDVARNFGLNVSGGYANSLDVTTYVASKLEAGMRWTEHFTAPSSFFSKANTFVYEFNFRRVKVQANSLQVAPSEIERLATAVRVGGPAITWIRDTRDSTLDAHRGTYTTFQEFLSDKYFGSEAIFNRIDVSNSSYWSFDKGQFVIARNTRYGQERAFGGGGAQLIPLPERLYAGGTTSLRGFGENAAGPRDPETGYPIGGAGALINSTEMRLPPPTLPIFGDALSFVIFHDMGNIFSNASDAWVSALRIHQPDRDTCKNPAVLPANTGSNSTGLKSPCSFNYFSHALGLGLRYHTPAGPLRLDFSYNLNTPIYPVYYNYSLTQPGSDPHVGEAPHFNYFFSLGQTF